MAETKMPKVQGKSTSPILIAALIAPIVALGLVILLSWTTERDIHRRAVFILTLTAIRDAWPEEGDLDREGLREVLSTFADSTQAIEVDWEAAQYKDDSRVYVVLYE